MAASLFGSVTNTNGSLISNWSGTALSRTAKLAGVNGISIVFDELGMATDSDVTSLIYQLSDGRSRERATQDGGLRDIQTWPLGFISTSEFSIFSKLQKAPGLTARILEFEDTKWTVSAQESDFIKDTIQHNSGVVIPKLLDWIFTFQSFDDFLEQTKSLFKQYHGTITTQLGNIPMASRIAQQVALILVAADLLKSAFNWDFL